MSFVCLISSSDSRGVVREAHDLQKLNDRKIYVCDNNFIVSHIMFHLEKNLLVNKAQKCESLIS